ncbi:MAG: transcriptional regulator [Desulfobacteraceae bacterium]|nr:MAG: transcriptional regulator [Desulfobacteraceae bacterium]
MRIQTSIDVGKAIRERRKQDGLTLSEAASLCGVGYRFLSDLENGKPTAELGKTLQVLKCLGLEIKIGPRSWPDA